MLQIKRFVNELMSSNCYVVSVDEYKNCIVIDPATERCEEIIEYMEQLKLTPEYIILTHAHTDHTWGCNTLTDKYDSKVVCSLLCKKALPIAGNAYFQFYDDNPDYQYAVKRVDVLVEDINYQMDWNGYIIKFISTPGHSGDSISISLENNLFTGDAVMRGFKPFIKKRYGGSCEKFRDTLNLIFDTFLLNTTIFPGHGEMFLLGEVKDFYKKYM